MMKVKHDLYFFLKKYKFRSVFVKNLVLMMTMIVIPFICMLGLSSYAYTYIQNAEEENYWDKRAEQINKDLESIFSELENKAILLCSDYSASTFFISDAYNGDEFYDVQRLLNTVSICKVTTEELDDIYLYSPFSQLIISTAGRSTYEMFLDQSCIDQWQNNKERISWSYMDRMISKQQKKSICFYYTTYQVVGKPGVVIFQINVNELDECLQYDGEVAITIDAGEQHLYDSAMHKNGEQQETMRALLDNTSGRNITSSALKRMGLQVTMHTQKKPASEQLEKMQRVMVKFISIMILVSVAVIFNISLKMFNPIKKIMKAINDGKPLESEDFSASKNEVGYIVSNVQEAQIKTKNIEKKLMERHELLKKAQAVALQAQISPHFLNNTLEAINWMVVRQVGLGNDISDMLNSLSQLLRTSYDTADMFVTLESEIEYVKKYVYIQQKRLGSDFEVHYSIPEDIKACQIIKMVLQPLVENAINYGIRPYDNSGSIWITAQAEEESIVIMVKDSGLGITEEEVRQINETVQQTVIKESDHIGLSNVNQRIILAYGEQYGVRLSSTIPNGTEVTITIPYSLLSGEEL